LVGLSVSPSTSSTRLSGRALPTSAPHRPVVRLQRLCLPRGRARAQRQQRPVFSRRFVRQRYTQADRRVRRQNRLGFGCPPGVVVGQQRPCRVMGAISHCISASSHAAGSCVSGRPCTNTGRLRTPTGLPAPGRRPPRVTLPSLIRSLNFF
jgi:hypothetical protein